MKSFLRLNYCAPRLLDSKRLPPFHFYRAAPSQQLRKYATDRFHADEMGKDKEKVHFQLKVPKGTKDWEGKDMVIRDQIFSTITEVFKRHGAVTIDTLVNLSILFTIVLSLTMHSQTGV